MSEANENVDCASLSFPSDKLSMLDLRRLFPNEFDQPPSITFFDKPDWPETLQDLLHAERCIAEYAFGHGDRIWLGPLAEGASDDEKTLREIEEEKRLCTQQLVKLYQKYGLASGPETANQLIRGIEAAVAQLRTARHPG
jgi:hypothetical protein